MVAAVGLDKPIAGLTDSKKLSKKLRNMISDQIYREAKFVGLGWVEPHEIDEVGLTQALCIASRRAVAELNLDYEEIIIDGNINFLPENPKASSLVKADNSVPAVSAASIVAKVARDEFMRKQAGKYPDYGFANNVGYGTKRHSDSIKENGVCKLHRRSFKPIRLADSGT